MHFLLGFSATYVVYITCMRGLWDLYEKHRSNTIVPQLLASQWHDLASSRSGFRVDFEITRIGCAMSSRSYSGPILRTSKSDG